MTIDEVLSKLEQLGCSPVSSGTKTWMAKCPAHADSDPSLSITEADDGKVLWKCHAGCHQADVMDALGMQRSTGTKNARPLPSIGDKIWNGKLVSLDLYYRSGEPCLAIGRIEPGKAGKGKDICQWTPDGAQWLPRGLKGKQPLFNVRSQTASAFGDPVAVVEGEPCVKAGMLAFPNFHFTTWPGGADAPGQKVLRADWSPLEGKEVVLIADADAPGRASMINLAHHLTEIGAARISVVLPTGSSKQDIADWIKDGSAKDTIKSLLRDFDPAKDKPVKEPESSRRTREKVKEEAPVVDVGILEKNQHYTVLGTKSDRVAFHIARSGIMVRSREACCSPNTLIAIADRMWWAGLREGRELDMNGSRALGSDLIRIAERKGPVDMDLVRERGALRMPDGQICYHLGDCALDAQGRIRSFDELEGIWIPAPKVALSEPASAVEKQAVMDALMQYRWKTPEDGKRLLAWIVTSAICGALKWHPHLQFTAPSGYGKSFIVQEVVAPIHGPLCLEIADASSAGLARYLQGSALPVLIDEAEIKNDEMQRILDLLRIASGGAGNRLRADDNGGAVAYRPRMSALLSSITTPKWTQAEETRFYAIGLGPEVPDWPKLKREILSSLEHPERIRSAIIHDAASIAARTSEIEAELQKDGQVDSRNAMMAAAMTAAWHWWGGTGYVGIKKRDSTSDAVDLLHDILATVVRLPGGETTIAGGLRYSRYHTEIAERTGVRLEDDGSLLIAGAHPGLNGLMRRGPWEKVKVNPMLVQIPGTSKTPNVRNFGGFRKHAVDLPAEVLEKHGIVISPSDEDGEPQAPF